MAYSLENIFVKVGTMLFTFLNHQGAQLLQGTTTFKLWLDSVHFFEDLGHALGGLYISSNCDAVSS